MIYLVEIDKNNDIGFNIYIPVYRLVEANTEEEATVLLRKEMDINKWCTFEFHPVIK